MNLNLEDAINKIIQNPYFLKLKEVVEDNSYHDHEDVYSHLIKTKNIAKREIAAEFITNPEAKKLFIKFVNEDFYGIKRSDILLLIALLHDIGKILYLKENGKQYSIQVNLDENTNICPGHEYEGSKIVENFVQDLDLPREVLGYISKAIKFHDTFNPAYTETKKDWPMEVLLSEIKSRADGLYLEAMFNIYCDCFTAAPFQISKEILIRVFNEPFLYKANHYVLS